jgi:stage IV sporulation protein FB
VGFRLLGVPVRVDPTFLLVVLLAWGVFSGWELLMWTVAVFLAVLLHEMGHALTARAAGAEVAVTLFALGGYTTWRVEGTLPPLRRLVIAAAGSIVGVATGGTVLLMARAGWVGSGDGLERALVVSFVYASLVWGILNWIPIRQLDGGHMMESFLESVIPQRSAAIARVISIVTGVAAALLAIRYRLYLAAVFAVVLTLGDFYRRAPVPDSRTRQPTAEPEQDPPAFPI